MKFKIKIEKEDENFFEMREFVNPSMAEYWCAEKTKETGYRHSIAVRPSVSQAPFNVLR